MSCHMGKPVDFQTLAAVVTRHLAF
jgi:hypothetical protein